MKYKSVELIREHQCNMQQMNVAVAATAVAIAVTGAAYWRRIFGEEKWEEVYIIIKG